MSTVASAGQPGSSSMGPAAGTGIAPQRGGHLHLTGIIAVWRRQLSSLLGNPLGYIFILAFVLATAASIYFFQSDKFYARNISDLGPLLPIMPWLLVVLLPALAMGAWATERDQGTEELLLTLPLSILDALLGKFLAVCSYFTIALLCSLSNVAALAVLGDPDAGLVVANYVGWWLAGMAFASLGLFASVIVSLPTIAFVLGMVLCGFAMLFASLGSWFDPFNRGVVPLGHVVVALAVIGGGLGASVLALASRRWRPGSGARVWAQVLSLAFGLILAVNVALIVGKFGAYADVSVEGQSSLSKTSLVLLKSIDEPVTITAYISKELPADMQLKAKEVEDKLSAVERASTRIKLKVKHPEDALDPAGSEATREFGMKTRQVLSDDAAGREQKDVFCGAAISCAGKTQVIEYFDPGLSVEYEVVRAVRAVVAGKKHVLGLAQTDLEMNGSFDFQSGGMVPEWEIVKEWKKQYEIRPVNLDSDVAADVEVLVVPQPSSLTQPQLEHLHDYIWNGRPTLLLEDPLPLMSQKAELIPSKPKKSPNQSPYGNMGNDDASAPKKGDIKPLWKALGLDYDENQMVWSDYIPSHQFRKLKQMPRAFVWIDRERVKGKDGETGASAGITSLLLPFAGSIGIAADKRPDLTVTPLIKGMAGYPWGMVSLQDVATFDYTGRMNLNPDPKIRSTGDQQNPPTYAVEITGTIAAAFPEPDPKSAPEAKAGESGPPAPERKPGVPSPKPVHVILVADSDFVSEIFFQLYRNQGGQFSDDDKRFLSNLRNVQFAGNVVDQLFNDKDYLDLRTRRPERRPLKRIEEEYRKTQDELRKATEQDEEDAEKQIARINLDFQRQMQKIEESEDDDAAKADKRATANEIGSRNVEIEISRVNQMREKNEAAAKSNQRQAIAGVERYVSALAIGIPSVLLALLVVIVWTKRLVGERSHVPAARKRVA